MCSHKFVNSELRDSAHESDFNHISRKVAKHAKKILCVSASLREIKRIFTSRQIET
jgi:hypothetical protein